MEGARDQHQNDLAEGLSAYVDYCLDSDVRGFDDVTWVHIHRFRRPKRHQTDLTMFDADGGPLTPAELASIDDALRTSDTLTPPDRAAVLLCRDWGLRPIQIALLPTWDLGEDEGGPFVLVPSVKGRVRSRMRRHLANRLKRYIADDTALAIQETLDWYRPEVDASFAAFKNLLSNPEDVHAIEHPIFPIFRSESRLTQYLQDESLRPYALMTESHRVSARIREVGQKIAIPSGEGGDLLELSASRFRYTKGVTLALQGFSAEYIAEALDHRSTPTVRHYCRYSMQLAAYINSVAKRSPEIGQRAIDGKESSSPRPIFQSLLKWREAYWAAWDM